MTPEPILAPRLQVFAAGVLLVLFGAVVRLVRRHQLSLRDSLLWLLSTGAGLVVAIFPGLLIRFSELLGIQVPSNALFALAFVYLLGNLLAANIAISASATRVRRLAQECALLRAELEELREARKDRLKG